MADDEAGKPLLKVTVFSDYICPFCYIGDLRLSRLREHFDLRVNWCAIEIHPETPAEGRPIESLGYHRVAGLRQRTLADHDGYAE